MNDPDADMQDVRSVTGMVVRVGRKGFREKQAL